MKIDERYNNPKNRTRSDIDTLVAGRAARNDRKMQDAIIALSKKGIGFDRPSLHQLKIDDLSFWPGKGTIFRDGADAPEEERGVDALIKLLGRGLTTS